MKIAAIGEILWDVFPGGEEHLGGATFNFCVNARRLGHDVRFLSAVGDDDRGRRALARAAQAGLPCEWIQTTAEAPTGHVAVALDADGQPRFTLHRPAAYDRLLLNEEAIARLRQWAPDWLCYGTLTFFDPHMLACLRTLVAACPESTRHFCDINLRPKAWTLELVRAVLALGVDAVKMNEAEAAELGGMEAIGNAPVCCITRAERGCTVRIGDDRADVAGIPIAVADAVGAGDAFSAGLLHGLSQGWPAARVGEFANRLGALVASRHGATPDWTLAELTA